MSLMLFTLAMAGSLLDAPVAIREPLSLEAALARANAQNPDLRALRERASASAARGQAIQRQSLPRFGVELNAQRTQNPAAVFAHKLNAGQFTPSDFDLKSLNSPDGVSYLGSSLFVEIPLDPFGRVNLAARAQAAGQMAFSDTVHEAEATTALQVSEAYWGAVLARQATLIAGRAVVAARSREAVTRARFNEGVALQSDVLRVRARRRAREADLASQNADLDVAESTLARLIAAPDGIRYDLTDSVKPAANLDSLETWKARAAAARPALLAAKRLSDAAALAVRLEEKASHPEAAAVVRLTDDRISRGGAQSWAAGAVVRWTLYDAARGKRVAAALAEQRAASEEERAAHDRVRFEVEAAFGRLAAAADRLLAATGGAEEGREALRVVQERRAQGLATLTDELETEAAAFAAELEETEAARSAALAEAALRRAAGINLVRTVQ